MTTPVKPNRDDATSAEEAYSSMTFFVEGVPVASGENPEDGEVVGIATGELYVPPSTVLIPEVS